MKLLIDVALEYLKKRVRNHKSKQAKNGEPSSQDENPETGDENWTDDEAMKIFLSIVKVLQINFPLYKVHKIYAAVSKGQCPDRMLKIFCLLISHFHCFQFRLGTSPPGQKVDKQIL